MSYKYFLSSSHRGRMSCWTEKSAVEEKKNPDRCMYFWAIFSNGSAILTDKVSLRCRYHEVPVMHMSICAKGFDSIVTRPIAAANFRDKWETTGQDAR